MKRLDRGKHLPSACCGHRWWAVLLSAACAFAATSTSRAHSNEDPFRKLTQSELSLGHYRTANGMPSVDYWQQQIDYDMSVRLDPGSQQLDARAVITYHNQSPDPLQYLFFALDHNALEPGSSAAFNLLAIDGDRSRNRSQSRVSASGFSIRSVVDASKQPLQWRVRDTHLQVMLPQSLDPDTRQTLEISWSLPLTDKVSTGARSGYELLADGSPIYVAAQWFPRGVAYTDYAGWQLKPFLQQGEFSTEFGKYRVTVEVPANYVVAASGLLQNAEAVLDQHQLSLWRAQSPSPTQIVSAPLAQQRRKLEEQRSLKRWEFTGDNLRDFAFSASPAFLWQTKVDAQGRRLQQFYPLEAAALWETFGLAAIEHTLSVFDSALSPLSTDSISIVNAAGIGMEYPGLATIATRPERTESTNEKPAWDALTKYDFIGTVIHEVGHNYLPMTINTDEREWAWLDEGLVSFIEYRGEHSWEANFDVIYGEPRSIARYTATRDRQAILTSADALHHKIDNAYNMTASVLNMLRHLVLGPEIFDSALKNFAHNWQGKRPTPGDFFRAMETAAATDLSWFWRSWFFDNNHIDLAISGVKIEGREQILTTIPSHEPPAIAYTAGQINQFVVDREPQLADAYTAGLTAEDKSTPTRISLRPGERHWHTLRIINHGEAILPVPLSLKFVDGHQQSVTLPAQTWMRADKQTLSIQLPLAGILSEVCIDPLWLTPDTQRNNNCVEVKAS